MNRLTKLLLFILPLLFACTQKEQEVQEVRVESVTLSQFSAEIEIGKTLQLNATVSPSTATRKDITWSSSKSSVASVSSSGLVTAVSEGTAKITATADGKKGECTVTVFKGFVAVSEVKLGKTEVTLFEGEEETLTASVLPEDATDKTITWTSSDKSIASVESGKVKAVKKGEATIMAKAGDKTAEAKIVVLAPVSGITLNKNRLDMIIGETETLTVTITPADADPKEPITWTTSDETIATVEDGKVTAVKEGGATVTASSDGKSASCIVKVDYIHVSEISLDITEKSLYAGETLKLTASVSPENSTYKTVEWTSSDKSVATVDAEGKVNAIGKGTTTITAKADGKEATCTLTVLTPMKGVSISKTALSLTVGESATLTATLIPTDATPREELSWSSSAPDVVSVDGGKVTAVGMGTATISASLEGFKAECNVTVKGMEYGKIAIADLRPEEIMPIIGQVEKGSKDFYQYMDHLRVVETTRISDMMWEYGAGSYSVEEYRSLMGRLSVMMVGEQPLWYDNYEIIGDPNLFNTPSGHAFHEWFVLNTLIKHANFKLIVYDFGLFKEFSIKYPDSFNVLACSTGATYKVPGPNADLREWDRDSYYDEGLFLEKNILVFEACANRRDEGEGYFNKICQIDADSPDDKSCYQRQASNANGKNDPAADRHHIITIATDYTGDVDLTDYIYESSCFPIGFHDDVLFAGHQFLYKNNPEDNIRATLGPWANSFCNYFNAAMASLCFQIKADMKDVDELLDMLRSTSLTDYIHQDGMTQRLHLINLAGVIKKYLLPTNLPAAVASDGSVELEKGYYKGVLFSIPGAEVKINGEWIAFDNKNKEAILSQNPMNLEWRLNGELLKKYGYTSGQTVEGQILTVDDKWGGLRLEVPMTIQIR